MARKVIAAKLEVFGVKQVMANLDKAGRDLVNAAVAGVQETTENAFNQSQAEVVVDKGPLRASAILVAAKKIGNRIESSIRYTRKYAYQIHETPPGAFNTPRKHGKWRYLADPIEQHAPGLINNVAAHIARAL